MHNKGMGHGTPAHYCHCTAGFRKCTCQDYPVRPVRVIVPSPAGGGIDTLAHLIGQRFTEKWQQPFVIDARPGATGIIGTAIAAKVFDR